VKKVLFSWVLFTFGMSTPCLAKDELIREYKVCVKTTTKQKPTFGSYRYGGDEFSKAVNQCSKLVEKDFAKKASLVESHRDITKLYISTLSFMNKEYQGGKNNRKEAPIDPSIPMIQSPEQSQFTEQKLDGFSQNDLSILYTQWSQCIAIASWNYTEKHAGGEDKSKSALQEASLVCTPVSQVADAEARQVILKHTRFRDSAIQSTLINNHKKIEMQRVLIALLMRKGANLGEALKKSIETTNKIIGDVETQVGNDTKVTSNAPKL
jgi:hypothetical protein